MIVLRSLAFNVAFYALMIAVLIGGTPAYLFLRFEGCIAIVRNWARATIWLHRVVAGTRMELRGVENIPSGGCIIAPKHQSVWETFAFLPLLHDPAYVIKEQLFWVPIWGWWAAKCRMIKVSRGRGSAALKQVAEGARREAARGRAIMIFPEGTRRPPGAEPAYKFGVAHIYGQLDLPVVPVALNSGLYWGRRKFMRHPGTIVAEFLPPIEPGLRGRDFVDRLTTSIETACDRLLVEADRAEPRPPFPPEAAARLAALKAAPGQS
jgi:1-acyl-sn-glycerol-3-phosphate acyltransferase